MIKADPQGGIQWQKTFGGSLYEMANSIRQTSDGGYIFVGSSVPINGNQGTSGCWIVKLDPAGNIQWQKSIRGSNNEFASDVQQTSDGGYIIAGTTYSVDGDISGNHGFDDFWIVKLDPAGNIQWQKCLGGSSTEEANSIQQTSDGGYIIAGSTGNIADGDITETYGFFDWWIVKLDAHGNIQWQKTFGGPYPDVAKSIQQTQDGGYIAAGIYGKTFMDSDIWIIKLSSTGDTQWQKFFGGSKLEIANSIQQTSDNGYFIAGSSNSKDQQIIGNQSDLNYLIIKTDDLGNLQWQKSLGGTGNDLVFSAIQTPDNGYLITGNSDSNDGDVSGNHGTQSGDNENPNYLYHDAWIVKLSPDPFKKPEEPPVTKPKLSPILYPNPAMDFIYVDRLPIDFPTEIIITDMAGRKIFTQKYQEEKIKINTSAFPDEAYHIQVKIKEEMIFSEKIIIRK
ncbi:T9SS type A sorting domain-containing protein [Chryseobacterium bernardetii]|uniref:T9SS type A sorting domain-containing protein n=1 Tax=Chryseobacterium bernardetii TaxID=1241978 RepID=UPI001E282A58|nr:T9SS type A sorting domain-containing protein [Chryseobacterium bernardetii]